MSMSICSLCEQEWFSENQMYVCMDCGSPVCRSCVNICCIPRRECKGCGFNTPIYAEYQDTLFKHCISCKDDYCNECDKIITNLRKGECMDCYMAKASSIKIIAANLETPEILGLQLHAALRDNWSRILHEYRIR